MTVPYEEAAAQAVAEVQQSGVDAGASLGQMSTDRPSPLPAEAAMDEMMAEFRAMTERVNAMETELAGAKRQYAAAAAALGPPEVAVYGLAIYDKLVSFRNAHPDLAGHFDRVIELARPLAQAAAAVIAGEGDVTDVTRDLAEVVAGVDQFVTRTHPRTAGKHIDFSALESDLEYATAAAGKLAALR